MRLIDADALKEWIDEYVSVFKKSDNKDIKGYIEHQPTIEPKRGEWIDTSNKIHYKCSVCDYRAPMIWEDYEVAEWLSDFCPNCGADMREREGE